MVLCSRGRPGSRREAGAIICLRDYPAVAGQAENTDVENNDIAGCLRGGAEQTGEMTYVGFAPRGTPPAALAALRSGFEGASNDPEFVDDAIKLNGVPFTFVKVARGQAIFRSLADVTPEVLATLRASIAAQN